MSFLAESVRASLTLEKQAELEEQTNTVLVKLIRSNYPSQFVSQSGTFAEFREAVSAHGGLDGDAGILVQDFRKHVPLSDYKTYQPFVDRFLSQPCMESEVESLLAPKLPSFLVMSSATSGTKPKLLTKYTPVRRSTELRAMLRYLNPRDPHPIAAVLYTGYQELVKVEREPGQVVQNIPICNASAAYMRVLHGWTVEEDESRMSTHVPGYVAPFSATMIAHHQSLLRIHGLFFLACRDLGTIYTVIIPVFIDLMQNIEDQWDRFLDCIRDGTIPDLDGIEHVRTYLQSHFHPDPDRAAELRGIGPPFSCEGWAARVWPNLTVFAGICTGPFATVVPKAKSIMGPNVKIFGPRYASSEGLIGAPYRGDNNTFIMENVDGKVLEFLDVTLEESHENISQSWQVKPGNKYEIVMSTQDGLWRYRLGDIVEIIGFDIDTGLPLLHFSGRKSFFLRLQHALVTDEQLLEAIQAINSQDTLQVQEFTTVLDTRRTPQTVGFFIELSGPKGPNAHLARQKLFDALVATNDGHEYAMKISWFGLPTIRLLKPGTFGAYRLWRAERMNSAGSSQIKVPVVSLDSAVQDWMSDWVVEEL